jgi:hypothetical protein
MNDIIDQLAILACISMACLIAYWLGYIRGQESVRPYSPRDRREDVSAWGDVPSVPGDFHSTGVNRKVQRDHV